MMAIFIGCMGLFGLAAFSAEQRVKEIGIAESTWREHYQYRGHALQNFSKARFSWLH
jgi:hypothetical protein